MLYSKDDDFGVAQIKSIINEYFPKKCKKCRKEYKNYDEFVKSTKRVPRKEKKEFLAKEKETGNKLMKTIMRYCECGEIIKIYFMQYRDITDAGLFIRQKVENIM